MNHLRPSISLLMIICNGNRIKFTLTIISPQDARGILPRNCRSSFYLGPHHLRSIAPAIRSLGDKVINTAITIFITRKPILNCRIFNFSIFFYDNFNHCCVKLRCISFGSGTAFKVRHITAFIRDYKCPFKLSCILGVNAKIC